MDERQIKQIIRNTQRVWFEDGVWEIGFAQALVLIGLYYWALVWFDLTDRLGLWLPLAQVVVFLAAFGSVRWTVGVLKERFSYPRTGYAAYRREPGSRRIKRAALGAGVGLLVGGLAVIWGLEGGVEARMPALFGLLFGGGMLYLGLNYAIRRYLAVGLADIALGALTAWLRPEANTSIAILMCAYGLLLAAAGALTLRRFVRQYPTGEEGEEE